MKKLAKGFSLVELMIVVAIIGILSAVAIPNFMKFQAKSRQSEAKQNLGGIHTAVTTYFSEKNKFPASDKVMGFEISGNNIYGYSSKDGIKSGDEKFSASDCTTAWSAVDSTGLWTAGAAGNVDNDETLDYWAINTHKCLANTKTALGADVKGSACITIQDAEDGNDVNN